jgi:peptide/nickel transport system permease protein
VADREVSVEPAIAFPPARRMSRSGNSYWGGVWRKLVRRPGAMAGAAVLAVIVLAAIFAPLVAPYNPDIGSIMTRLKPFGYRGHLLGADELGRDMLSRLIYGGRVSLLMGVVPVIGATLIGGAFGIAAGFGGRLANTIIMRVMDVFYAFPSVLLAVAITGAMGGGVLDGMIALTLVFIPPMCRVTETATAQISNLDFIEAARASGAGGMAIVRYHVIGNVLGPVLVYASSLVSVSILLSAGLSFLGLSVHPPTADWGLMLSTLIQSVYVVPWVCALPGAAIFITSVSFSLLSDGLRAAMNVRA